MANANTFGVAVVGLGRFGLKRVHSISKDPRTRLRVVSDIACGRARDVADEMNCEFKTAWEEAVSRDDVDIVIVSTSTQFLSLIALSALQAGKHVLCEKPFGRNAQEVLPAVLAARSRGLALKVGYNHRYHPALQKAHEIWGSGKLGRLHFLRCVYGHGGRAGYEREWRTKAESAGGGQLLDQGVHALDLFRWFAGEFVEVKAVSDTCYWPIAPLEDNIFALLRNAEGCVAQLHASWTSWKNTFRFEVSAEHGYLSASGLGGSYGTESLVHGVRVALGHTPQEYRFEFPQPDESLKMEWTDFLDCIEQGKAPQSSGEDGLRTLQLAESIYAAAHTACTSVDYQCSTASA